MATIYKIYIVRRFWIVIAFTCKYMLAVIFAIRHPNFTLFTFTINRLIIFKLNLRVNRWTIIHIKLQENIILMKNKQSVTFKSGQLDSIRITTETVCELFIFLHIEFPNSPFKKNSLVLEAYLLSNSPTVHIELCYVYCTLHLQSMLHYVFT